MAVGQRRLADGTTEAWAPSTLHAVAGVAVENQFGGVVHVRGRVTDTGRSGRGTQFVTIVDEGETRPRWDSARLGLVVFAWVDERLRGRLGGEVSRVLEPGTVIDAIGEVGLAPGDGALQLRVARLAIATDSSDAAAAAELRARIEAEDWVGARPPLPPVLRRVGALISVAGDGDLDEALRLLEHDAFAPAFCRHRIHPLSATARDTVPALLDHHVRSGVDAVLVAFGGHLPSVSAWDSVEVLEAIHRAHLAGVPVVAGFAHGADQPLTKLVAHNHAQASAAVTALVRHNRGLLGRLEPAVRDAGTRVAGAAARADGHLAVALDRARRTTTAVADRDRRQLAVELGRVTTAAAALAARDPLAAVLPEVVAALGDPAPALRDRLVASLGTLGAAADRTRGDLRASYEAAGRLPALLGRGFALVTAADGSLLPSDRAPAAGTRITVTTAGATYDATVDAPTTTDDPAPSTEDPT